MPGLKTADDIGTMESFMKAVAGVPRDWNVGASDNAPGRLEYHGMLDSPTAQWMQSPNGEAARAAEAHFLQMRAQGDKGAATRRTRQRRCTCFAPPSLTRFRDVEKRQIELRADRVNADLNDLCVLAPLWGR